MGQIIKIQGRQFLLLDLIIFGMLDFNMILAIDFLGRNRAEINNWCKKVWSSLKNKDQFEFDERHIKNIIISAIKRRKMLSKRYIGFLAHMVSTVELGPSIE